MERKKKPNVEPKLWDYLDWQGEQPTIDDLPRRRAPEPEAEVEALRSQLRGAVERAEQAERELRGFVDGLTEALNDHGVPAMPSWGDAIDWLAAHGGAVAMTAEPMETRARAKATIERAAQALADRREPEYRRVEYDDREDAEASSPRRQPLGGRRRDRGGPRH